MPPPEPLPDPQAPPREPVVEGYAQVLVTALGRTSQTVFDLAGLKLYADLRRLQLSLARCREAQDEPRLRLWDETLQQALATYQAAFAEVAEAHAWLTAIRAVLAEAPLPDAETPGLGADEVARQLAHVLGAIADRTDLSPCLSRVRTHLLGLSERYWSGLFRCYDLIGLPRTNNDLESTFGGVRRDLRRQSGFKHLRRPLMRAGAWLVYDLDAEDVGTLHQRLAGVTHAAYRAERARFEQRQARFRQRLRWQHKPDTVLADLEARWSDLAAHSTP